MKHTRMERHEEKIRAVVKRNKRIITFTTLVGLVCPATLGTIQVFADETAPTTEQTAKPVAEPVTQPLVDTQPTEPVTETQPTEAPSQEPASPEPVEPVTPEPEQTTPNEQVPEMMPAESTLVQEPTVEEPQTSLNEATQELETLAVDPTVTARYQAIVDSYKAVEQELFDLGASTETTHFMYEVSDGIITLQMDVNNYAAGIIDESNLEDLFNFRTPILDTDIQRVRDQLAENPDDVSVTGVTLTPIPEMGVGGTYQLTATITPDNATNKNVTWASNNTAVATVDSNGNVTAISEGTFTITVTTVDGGFNASTNGIVNSDDGKPMKDFDYTAVLAAIARYDAMVKDEYTPESWSAMEAEMINNDEKLHLIDYLRQLPNAEGTVPPGYENQFQTDLNAYAAKAQSIMDLAVKKDVTPPKDVDDSKLEEAIKEGEEAIKEGGWKDDTNLSTAIEDGKKVIADDNATQSQIDEATKNINDAINALEKADNGGNGNNGGNNNGGAGNGNNGNNSGNTGNGNNGAGGNSGNNSGAGTGSNNQNGNGNKTGTNANNTSNKVVHTNTNTSSSNSNKDNLPQTGEETTITTALAGFAMVGLSVVAWIKRRRKA